MIPFEKPAGLWKGGGFLGEPDYGFADSERSVVASGRFGEVALFPRPVQQPLVPKLSTKKLTEAKHI